MLYSIIICLFAGMGAGLGTGFAGLSAAAVISPMLITFLKIPAYSAVAISLASDVLASAISAYTYHKHGNLDIKNGIIMMISVLCFTVVGSYIASLLPNHVMGNFSVFMTMLLGFRFIFNPVQATKESMKNKTKQRQIIESILCGSCIGFICGFIGAGGGMMMLLILTSVLGYELKMAIGTSVFIMAFTAFTGSFSHILIGGLPDMKLFGLCVIFTFIFARIGSKIANKVSNITLNRITGIILVIIGAVVLSVNYLF